MNEEEIIAIGELSEEITGAIQDVARSIAGTAGPGHDAAGGTVMCLTEAVMGITAGLFRVADAIEYLADKQAEREG